MTAEQARALYNLSEFFTWRTAILRSELPPLCKYTLLVLSCHMNELGSSCFPSIKTLAGLSGLGRGTIIKSIRQAVEGGWLDKNKAGFAGRKWRHNTYKATLPNVVHVVDHLIKGGAPGGLKAVHPVDTISSVISSKPVDKGQIQQHVKNLKARLVKP